MKIFALCATFALGSFIHAKDRTVIIPPFENLSARKAETEYGVMTGANPNNPRNLVRIDRYAHVPREVLEDIVVRVDGLKPVERQRLDQFLLELGGKAFQGAIDGEKVRDWAIKIGADAIIQGTVMEVTQGRSVFQGYGIEIKNTVWTAKVRVRLIDLAGGVGRIPFSKILSGSYGIPETVYFKQDFKEEDVAFNVMQSALDKLRDDQEFIAALRAEPLPSTEDPFVDVLVDVTPLGADVFIDEKYAGTTSKAGLKIRMRAGREASIRIEKRGFMPWSVRIQPERGFGIVRSLEEITKAVDAQPLSIQLPALETPKK